MLFPAIYTLSRTSFKWEHVALAESDGNFLLIDERDGNVWQSYCTFTCREAVFLRTTWSRGGRNSHIWERHYTAMNVSPTSETHAVDLVVAWEMRQPLETGGPHVQGVLDTLLPTTDTALKRCKSVPLEANTSAARVRVLGVHNTSMATFLNMLKKIA